MEKLKPVVTAIISTGLKNQFFSLDQAIKRSGVDREGVRRALERLCRDGLVRKIEFLAKEPTWKKGRPQVRIIYRVTNRKALEERIEPKLKEDTAQDRMWKVMRYMGVFSRGDLIQIAQVSEEHVRWFTKMLHRAGFIRPSKKTGPGVIWRLIKDVGPKRPYVTSRKGQVASGEGQREERK